MEEEKEDDSSEEKKFTEERKQTRCSVGDCEKQTCVFMCVRGQKVCVDSLRCTAYHRINLQLKHP